jgi:hypothetical protein
MMMHVHHGLGRHRLGAGWRTRCCVLCNGIAAKANCENDCSDKGLDHGRGSFVEKPPSPPTNALSRILSETRITGLQGEQTI